VAEYVELATGKPADMRTVGQIHADTDGNPLFVAEMMRLLGAEGAIRAAVRPLGLPEGVREVIERRLGRLSGECRRVLIEASVLGREFGLVELERLSDLSRDKLFAVLDEAMAEKVVGEAPGAAGRLRFAHVLVRDAAYGSLSGVRRMELHGRAGEALEAVHAGDPEPHLAELAHHFVAAAPAGSREKAIHTASAPAISLCDCSPSRRRCGSSR
jgi:predicted ATPase